MKQVGYTYAGIHLEKIWMYMKKAEDFFSRRWFIYTALLLMIWAAFGLRLINIDAFSFWTDEALTPLRASYSVPQILRNDVVIQDVVTKDTHPPFYYLIIHVTRPLWGESDFSYRFPSVLAGVLLVPLLYQFGRRLRGKGLGMMAAMLTAVNPLQIWYANEARMYTLFVLLLAAASYVLWRALTGAPLVRSLILYLLLAGLAFYTHYTAVFIIAVQALFGVGLLWQHGQKKLIIGVGLIGLLAAIPLVPYTIPRLFSGAEANFYYVRPLTMLQDVVRFFSLGVTVDFSQIAITLLAALSLILLLLGLYAAGSWQCRAFLLSYLLAVVFGLMVGSYLFKPMYQGVRHIIGGSPAFILLTAWGVLFVWGQAGRQKKGRRALWAIGGVLSLALIFVGPAWALTNLYAQPSRYAKDDFRALIRYIEQTAGEKDVVVYNNAVMLPFHAHYQQRDDLPVTAVPRYPHPAQAEDPELVALTRQYDRIWLVTDPPADGRDDERLVQTWLENNLLQVDQRREFSQNGVVEALAFSQLRADGAPLERRWPDAPILRGIDLAADQPTAGSTLWLSLYWQTALASADELAVQFVLQDSAGKTWLTEQRPFYPPYDPDWSPASLTPIPYHLALPLGLPPGDYTLLLRPLGENGRTALGELQPVSHLTIAGTASQPLPVSETDDPFHIDKRLTFDNGLQLSGWAMPEAKIRPGHALPLTMYWQAPASLETDDLRYELRLVGSDGAAVSQESGRIAPEWLAEWPGNTLLMTPSGLYFPPEIAPGQYQLTWRVLSGEQVVGARPFWRPWSTAQNKSGVVEVVAWPLITDLPTGITPADATFGPAISLHGYALDQPTPEQLDLTLVWQAKDAPINPALVFVHLVSAETGEIVAQEDRVPGNNLRPPNGWRKGEVITDTFTLRLPANAEPGQYALKIGFYNPDDGVRLPVLANGAAQADDLYPLTTVTRP